MNFSVNIPRVLRLVWVSFICMLVGIIWTEYYYGIERLGNTIAGTIFLIIVGVWMLVEFSN